MELVKKTTILFTPELYGQLERLAKREKRSVGELVREACRRQYKLTTREGRQAALDAMKLMNAPVGSVEQMKRESIPEVEPLP